MNFVSPLSLNVTINSICLGVANSLDFERDVGRRLCLDFKGGAIERVVLSEQVIRRLSEILVKGDQ